MALATPTTPALIAGQVAPGVGPVSITVPPPTMIDVTLDNPNADAKIDLDTYMSSIGYVFMEENPTPLQNGETVVWENGAWTCVTIASNTASSLSLESTTKVSFVRKVRNSFTVDGASGGHVGKWMARGPARVG
jgi:hypothetical protein